METYTDYKGYGITYSELTGNTAVNKYGFPLRVFMRKGEEKGLALAKSYIDNLTQAKPSSDIDTSGTYMPDPELEADAIERLNDIYTWDDLESSHIAADQVLVDLLNSLGYSKVTALFERMDKWYA